MASAPSPTLLSPLALTAGGRPWHRPLLALAAACGAVTLLALAAMAFDDRTLLGESVWVKVAKFGFSFCVYAVSLAWLLAHLTRAPRTAWWLATVFAAISAFEVGVITLAAARGTYSHFNTADDPVNRVVQVAFQYGIPIMLVINLVVAVIVLFQRVGDRAVTAVARWGLALATLGMGAAFAIVSIGGQGKRTQLDAEGNEVPLSAGHGVGDLDGHGMLLTGWSTTGGDMRPSHFLGLHAIQVLIALAMVLRLLSARRCWLADDRHRAAIVRWFSIGYLGLFATAAWQALRGQSFAHPDRWSLTAYGASLLVAAVGIALTARNARKRTGAPVPASPTAPVH